MRWPRRVRSAPSACRHRHANEKAIADRQRLQPARGGLAVPKLVAHDGSLRKQCRRNAGKCRKSSATLNKCAPAGFARHHVSSPVFRQRASEPSRIKRMAQPPPGARWQRQRLRGLHLLAMDRNVLRLGSRHHRRQRRFRPCRCPDQEAERQLPACAASSWSCCLDTIRHRDCAR